MASEIELLKEIKTLIFTPKIIVSCPAEPIMIPGITAADAFDANDAMGTIVIVQVPKSGVIYSATFYDLDYEGTQVDLEIFKRNITQVASDAAWTCSDTDIMNFVTELQFYAFDSHTACYTSESKNFGKAYNAPEGKFYIQAVTRSTPTIVAGASPKFQLQIQSFDPLFEV